MSKAERKREAREKRDQARAAQKAANRDARNNEPAPVAGARVPFSGDVLPQQQDRLEQARATVERTADAIQREFQAQLDADPELRETLQAVYGLRIEQRKLDRTVEQAEDDLREAQETVKQAHTLQSEDGDPSTGSHSTGSHSTGSHSTGSGQAGQAGQAVQKYRRRISDQRALEMLEDAAEACHEVLLMVRETLRGVSPERREAARAILNEKPAGEARQPNGVDGRKQPRRAPDPVVTLMKLELQASSLLKRILAKTNPNVGKKAA